MAKFDVDPVVSLALSMVTAPGMYALFLGSGVSRAAGISTGWDVTLDLVRKAAAGEEDASDDPLGWYRGRFGKDPDYSEVIDGVARSQAERRVLEVLVALGTFALAAATFLEISEGTRSRRLQEFDRDVERVGRLGGGDFLLAIQNLTRRWREDPRLGAEVRRME